MKKLLLELLVSTLFFVNIVSSNPIKAINPNDVKPNSSSTECDHPNLSQDCQQLNGISSSLCKATVLLAEDACIIYGKKYTEKLPNTNLSCPISIADWPIKYANNSVTNVYLLFSKNESCLSMCRDVKDNKLCKYIARLLVLLKGKNSEKEKSVNPDGTQRESKPDIVTDSPNSKTISQPMPIDKTEELTDSHLKVTAAGHDVQKQGDRAPQQSIPIQTEKHITEVASENDNMKKQTPSTVLNTPDPANNIDDSIAGLELPEVGAHPGDLEVPRENVNKETDDDDDDDMNVREGEEEPRPEGDVELEVPGVSSKQKQNKDPPEYHQLSNGAFVEAEDSHFFIYFITFSCLTIIGYIAFHNKNKEHEDRNERERIRLRQTREARLSTNNGANLNRDAFCYDMLFDCNVHNCILALALEGRRGKGNRRRPNSASYRKLDSCLEEAVMSQPSHAPTAHVIY